MEEKIFTIPLSKAYKKSWRKRVPYSVSLVKGFVQRHLKSHPPVVKIGENLNKHLWLRSKKRPPRKVKVKILFDKNIAKVELFGYEYKEFKPEKKQEGGGLMERLQSRASPKTEEIQKLEDKIEGKKPESEKPKAKEEKEPKEEKQEPEKEEKQKEEAAEKEEKGEKEEPKEEQKKEKEEPGEQKAQPVKEQKKEEQKEEKKSK